MRQAKEWHDQAGQLADEARAASEKGDSLRASEKMRQAFELARRAADHCRKVEEEIVTSYHREAAHFALACGEFQEAMRLTLAMGRVFGPGNPEAVCKRRAEVHEQVQEIGAQAEAVRSVCSGHD